MNGLAAGLLGGILIALAVPYDWQQPALHIVAGLALVAALGGWRVPGAALLAGFMLAQSAAERVLEAAYDCGERRLVVAYVDSIPVPQDSGWQYDAWVEPASPPAYPALRVRVRHPGSSIPAVGERWQLLLQFDAPEGGAAEARRRNLLRDHLSATARVRESPLNRRVQAATGSIDRLRTAVAAHIQRRVADPSAAALLAALAVGVTGDVSTLQWRVFSATGITHLVAISGMHVTFFAVLCMAAARALWRHWGWLRTHARRESFAAVVGILLAFGYALLSGFSVPAQRTALMLAVFLAARCAGREVAPTWSVAASLAAVLLLDPLAVLGAGFWLSFGAVVAIIVLAGGRLRPAGTLRAGAAVQWVVTVALLPVTAALFGGFSAVGPLVNALAIPLFTFALVPPVLVATALYLPSLSWASWLADHLVDVAAWTARQGWPWLVRAADLPGAVWNADAGGLWLALSIPAVVCVLAPLPALMRWGALAMLASGFLVPASRPPLAALDVLLFDVGASRAVLLRTRDHQLLVGTGEAFGTAGRRFERAVLPELRRAGSEVDLLLERADRDSLRALAMASARLPLRRVIAAGQPVLPGLLPCSDQDWRWDGVEFFRRASPDGCWLGARAGAGLVTVAPPRLSAAAPPQFDAASLLVLPRRAPDAARLMQRARPGALGLAGLSQAEWQSAGWRAVRDAGGASEAATWSTATGPLRVRLQGDGRLAAAGSTRWPWGIWSRREPTRACTTH